LWHALSRLRHLLRRLLCEQVIDEIRADLGEASPFETEVGDNDE